MARYANARVAVGDAGGELVKMAWRLVADETALVVLSTLWVVDSYVLGVLKIQLLDGVFDWPESKMVDFIP